MHCEMSPGLFGNCPGNSWHLMYVLRVLTHPQAKGSHSLFLGRWVVTKLNNLLLTVTVLQGKQYDRTVVCIEQFETHVLKALDH